MPTFIFAVSVVTIFYLPPAVRALIMVIRRRMLHYRA